MTVSNRYAYYADPERLSDSGPLSARAKYDRAIGPIGTAPRNGNIMLKKSIGGFPKGPNIPPAPVATPTGPGTPNAKVKKVVMVKKKT
jgi:hypothetical protein